MITDRTTEEDNPVRKANAHKKRITRKNPKGLKAAHRFHKKEKKNKNKVERLLEKYCKLNIEKGMLNNKFTMQTLRHAAICYMLSGGASKDLVASYAGITTKWITIFFKKSFCVP